MSKKKLSYRMTSKAEWETFTEDFNKFVNLVEDFKALESKFRILLKQKNLEIFCENEPPTDDKLINTMYGIISVLNKQLLKSVIYEKSLQEFTYKLMLKMSSIMIELQNFIKHPDLDFKSLDKYYNCIGELNNLGSTIEGKYVDYLTLYTLKNSNKREIICALAAEVQLLKLALKEKDERS